MKGAQQLVSFALTHAVLIAMDVVEAGARRRTTSTESTPAPMTIKNPPASDQCTGSGCDDSSGLSGTVWIMFILVGLLGFIFCAMASTRQKPADQTKRTTIQKMEMAMRQEGLEPSDYYNNRSSYRSEEEKKRVSATLRKRTSTASTDVSYGPPRVSAVSDKFATNGKSAVKDEEWYYSDREGNIQGPFPTTRMRKWTMDQKLPAIVWVRPPPNWTSYFQKQGIQLESNDGFAPIEKLFPSGNYFAQ